MSIQYTEFTQSIRDVLSRMSLAPAGKDAQQRLPKLIVVDEDREEAPVWVEEWTFEAHISEMRKLGAV